MTLDRPEAGRSRAIAPRTTQAEHRYVIRRQLDHNAQPPDAYDFGSVIVRNQRSFVRVHLWCSRCWLMFFLRHAPVIIILSILLATATAGWLLLL